MSRNRSVTLLLWAIVSVTVLLASSSPALAVVRHFQTGGHGVFFPANLGVGDPAQEPTIIGDGSGYSAYDGTPTGNEFKLNGRLVGDGWDQHFGAAHRLEWRSDVRRLCERANGTPRIGPCEFVDRLSYREFVWDFLRTPS